MPGSAVSLVVTLLASHLWQIRAALFPIQDSRPNLASPGSSGDSLTVVEWWAGGPAYLLASSGAVRINFRGIHTYPPSAHMRLSSDKTLMNITGWKGSTCNVSAWAMCSSESGGVLPQSVPRMPEAQGGIPDDWVHIDCSNTQGKVLVSQGIYDISACDIMDEGLDVVYSAGMLFHARTALPTWRYWVCVALSIALVRALSYNVQGLWTRTSKKTPNLGMNGHSKRLTLGLSLALVILVLIDLDRVFITKADQVYFWSSIFYVGCYTAIHASTFILASEGGTTYHHQPVFNVIVAALQVFAMRLYTSAETPYNLLLTGMLACRAWTKLLMASQCRSEYSLSLLLDSLYLSLCIELGSSDSQRDSMVAVMGVAFVAAQLLSD